LLLRETTHMFKFLKIRRTSLADLIRFLR